MDTAREPDAPRQQIEPVQPTIHVYPCACRAECARQVVVQPAGGLLALQDPGEASRGVVLTPATAQQLIGDLQDYLRLVDAPAPHVVIPQTATAVERRLLLCLSPTVLAPAAAADTLLMALRDFVDERLTFLHIMMRQQQ